MSAAVFAVLPVLVAFTWPGTVEWLCTRGIKQYQAGQFEDAEASFARALEADPDNNTVEFNRGTTLHRRGLHDEASEAFEAAGSGGGPELARDAAYNRGNSRFAADDYEGAIEAYRDALRLDPGDGEAKHNLE
ncbi:MAG: tetratricopeptide repeat protein, partial [Armatimonadota bacterium]